MSAIGFLRADRLTCAESPYHLPGCHNAALDRTWCICGAVQWPGAVGVWKCVERRGPAKRRMTYAAGSGAQGVVDDGELIGWDTYWLDAWGMRWEGDR